MEAGLIMYYGYIRCERMNEFYIPFLYLMTLKLVQNKKLKHTWEILYKTGAIS